MMEVIFRFVSGGNIIRKVEYAVNPGYTNNILGVVPIVGDIIVIDKCNYKVAQRIIDVNQNTCHVFVNKVTHNDYCLAQYIN